SPHALRIPDRSGHPALRYSCNRHQVRLGCIRLSPSCPFRLLHTALLSRPARHYPRFRIRRSSSERRGDFNPPDSRAAQHTLRAHPSPSRPRPTSRLSRLYDRPCSGDFAPGRGGFLPPPEVKEPHRPDFGSPCRLALRLRTRPSGLRTFEATFAFTRRLSEGDVVDRLQSLGFRPRRHPNYGAPDSWPDRPFSW